MEISMKLNDRFYRLIAFGLGITYIFQVFLTIGGGSKFIPLTGVTLPLISYGGSSVLTTLVMFAIVEGLCMVKKDEEQAVKNDGKGKRAEHKKKEAQNAGRKNARWEKTGWKKAEWKKTGWEKTGGEKAGKMRGESRQKRGDADGRES